ncbi:hypothetical protein [Xanthomonas euvesicatoria]|uniref:hypothetical protein n=1 Tax=Xanthomonas euvesicatoria TaxID=456327 RepID=UPI00146FC8D1|nr:hypothetical protein [Xanthomonas euvesicatoria]MCC8613063.1 hypothetical protein [Xanthomonas euvesicatoria pv. euvesicatoria]
MNFNNIKSSNLNLRVTPSFKRALKAAADHEQRSMVNMLEVLVASYCENNHISIPPKSESEVHAAGKSQARTAL